MLKSFVGGFVLGAFLLVALAVSLLVSGCASDSPERAIIGKWQKPGQPVTMHFFESGDMDFVNHGEQLAGSYRWVDDTHIRFGAHNSEAGILEVHIQGDTLTTKTARQTEVWKRVTP